MSKRFHEIAETNHRIQNPFANAKLFRLAEICDVHANSRVLDLACGKGELLCQWADRYKLRGTGVDTNPHYIQNARERADELKVWSQVNFSIEDASEFPQPFHQYDMVSCLGASWIGGGMVGTIDLMRLALDHPHEGLLVIGDVFWKQSPTDEVCEALGIERDYLTNLAGISDRFDTAQVELLEMLISSQEEWDDYYSSQWLTVSRYLMNNPDDPETDALREWIDHHRRTYLKYERDFLGWGIFVLRYTGRTA